NITPIRENGRTIGYMSVRTKAERAQIAAAESAYREIREHGTQRIAIQHGHVIQRGIGGWMSRLSHVSLAMRIWLCTSVVNVLLAAVCIASLFGDGSNDLVRFSIFGATGIGLLINVFLWHTLRVGMLRPLGRALDGARLIASGDLSGSFDSSSSDEVGQ